MHTVHDNIPISQFVHNLYIILTVYKQQIRVTCILHDFGNRIATRTVIYASYS